MWIVGLALVSALAVEQPSLGSAAPIVKPTHAQPAGEPILHIERGHGKLIAFPDDATSFQLDKHEIARVYEVGDSLLQVEGLSVGKTSLLVQRKSGNFACEVVVYDVKDGEVHPRADFEVEPERGPDIRLKVGASQVVDVGRRLLEMTTVDRDIASASKMDAIGLEVGIQGLSVGSTQLLLYFEPDERPRVHRIEISEAVE